MSSFDNSTLMIEAEAIINSPEPASNYSYSGSFLVGDIRYPVLKVIGKESQFDYVNDFAENTSVEVVIGLGTYEKHIFPFRESIRFELVKTPNDSLGMNEENKPNITIYSAVISNIESGSMASGTNFGLMDAEVMDLASFKRFRVELVDMNVNLIKSMYVGTVIVGKTPKEALEGVLTVMGKAITRDRENAILGVSVAEPDNNTLIKQFPIEHNTRLVDFPDYLQNRIGIYNSGLGFFYKDRKFYVWSLYNYKRSSNSEKKATFIIAPANRFSGVEKTYRKTANQVVVLITGGSRFIDPSEIMAQTYGTGIRMAKPTSLLEGFAKVANGVANVLRSEGVLEFVAGERAGELKRTVMVAASDNIYKVTSSLANKAGARMILTWENSDSTLLYPGMPTEVIIEKDGLPVTLPATILEVHDTIGSPSDSISINMHRSVSKVMVFIDKTTTELSDYRSSLNNDWFNEVETE